MSQEGHGGNVWKLAREQGINPADIIDFSANINPLGLPSWFTSLINRELPFIVNYPDPESTSLVEAIAKDQHVEKEQVIVGNGSTEILYAIPKIFAFKKAIIPVPAYIDYKKAVMRTGIDIEIEEIFLKEDDGFYPDISLLEKALTRDSIVFICHPNNPTGLLWDIDAIYTVARKNPSSLFVIDESFGGFVANFKSMTRYLMENVLVLVSFTKLFAIPGLRLGYALGSKKLVSRIRDLMLPWSVNTLAQKVGEAAIKDKDYVDRTRSYVRQERKRVYEALSRKDIFTVYPGKANFLLVRIDDRRLSASTLSQRLINHGIAIRSCKNFTNLDDRFFRIAIKKENENDILLDKIESVVSGRPSIKKRPRKTPAIMFQGTASNVGKSILVAALCRILLQDGYRVAPFKAQNMSLNSFVTRDGGEMGRAQVVQAQAAKLDPDVRMNPILLKPSTDTGSQVIVMGKPVENMDVNEYIRYKPIAFKKAKEAFDSLAREYDVIVMEGAGSPSEVNLKAHDIVNMKMAEYAEASVFIIGDIDRGGVFASFVGTIELLDLWERELVKGFIINKFRGDPSLLGDAISFTQERTSIPIIGVVPYIRDMGIPDEDSVKFKSERPESFSDKIDSVEIAVIDLPHISNFTDIDPFRLEPDVNLKIVTSRGEIGRPDALIIPGSKNVISDLLYLKEKGIFDEIIRLFKKRDITIVGLCGGFQMLGSIISDPYHLESSTLETEGLSLLPLKTVLEKEKTLILTTAMHLPSKLPLKGYEIHHGKTEKGEGLRPVVERDDGEVIGVGTDDGRVWGTYLHGVFDMNDFRRWFIDELRIKRGLNPIGKVVAYFDIEDALDNLADIVRRSLDLQQIYKFIKAV